MATCSTTPLNTAQLEQLAIRAGFNASQAPTMAAIALAESGGCPTSTNPYDNNGTQTSWGLWQISYGNHIAPSHWNDPQTNANLAYQKYTTQGLGAWGTYTTGKYKNYLQGGNGSVTSPTTSTTSNPAFSNLPWGLGGAIGAVQTTLVNAVEEIGVFLLAIVIIILGVIILNTDEIKGLSHRVTSSV